MMTRDRQFSTARVTLSPQIIQARLIERSVITHNNNNNNNNTSICKAHNVSIRAELAFLCVNFIV